MEKEKKGKIFVFSAPSGAGKTTILDNLRKRAPELVYSVSVTTRKPRRGEIDGVHYFFTSTEKFREKIDTGAFAEWQEVHGNYYGTLREFIDEAVNKGKSVVMDIDVYGKKKFDELYPDAVGILVLPPGFDELERRLRSRGTDDEQTILTRLANARGEVEFAKSKGKYEYTVVNDDLERSGAKVFEIVESESAR